MNWKYFIYLLLTVIVALLIYSIGKYLFLFKKTGVLINRSAGYTRDYYVGDKTNREVTYVSLGDSTAEGTGSSKMEDSYPYLVASDLASQGKYVHVLNYAISGAKSADIPGQMKKIKIQPGYICLTVGANDATHFISYKKYKDNLKVIKSLLEKYPKAKVVIANTPRMSDIPAFKPLPGYFINKRAVGQNKVFNEAFRNSKYGIVDLYDDARLESKFGNRLYATDLFHPSDEGYLIWSKFFIQAINS